MKKKPCEILVFYPENRDDELKLRMTLGKAYLRILESYISSLDISDKQKKELFIKTVKQAIKSEK